MNDVIYKELIILYVLCMNTNNILVHLFNVELLVQDKYFFNLSIHEVLVCSMYLTSSVQAWRTPGVCYAKQILRVAHSMCPDHLPIYSIIVTFQ